MRNLFKLVLPLSAMALATGCAMPTFTVNVDDPEASSVKYDVAGASAKTLSVTDTRDELIPFTSGILQFNVAQNGETIDEFNFVVKHTVEELQNRGVDVSLSGNAETKVAVKDLALVNHRANGFAPLVTFTSLSADVDVNGETQRVASFVRRAKVPVWAITEKGIVENVFNQPLEVLVNDFASHINRVALGYKVSDADLEAMISAAKNPAADDGNHYLKVYELGFTNNKKAVPTLVELTKSTDEYVRLAAISSLGTLDAESEFALLKDLSENAEFWHDRGVALLAIGNLDTAEGNAFLKAMFDEIAAKSKKSKEDNWNSDILKLFM